jgi:hypothetical protein
MAQGVLPNGTYLRRKHLMREAKEAGSKSDKVVFAKDHRILKEPAQVDPNRSAHTRQQERIRKQVCQSDAYAFFNGKRRPSTVWRSLVFSCIFLGSGRVRYVSMIEGDGHDARGHYRSKSRRTATRAAGVLGGIQAADRSEYIRAWGVGFPDCSETRPEHEPGVHVAAGWPLPAWEELRSVVAGEGCPDDAGST